MELMRPEDRPQVLRGANEMLLRVLDYGETPILAPFRRRSREQDRCWSTPYGSSSSVSANPAPTSPSQEILVATIEIISATTSLDGFHLTEEAQQADDALAASTLSLATAMWWPTMPAQERSRHE